MKALASFIIRSSLSAALIAASCAVLSLLFPPLLVFSGASIALVSLRKGAYYGLLTIAIASLGTGLLAYFALGAGLPVIILALLQWLPVLLLSIVLRATVSLTLSMQAAALFGVLAVFVFYLVLGDPALWWTEMVNQMFTDFAEAGLFPDPGFAEQMSQQFAQWAPLLPGHIAASAVLSAILALLLGRWWQSLLYYPGGFQEEFHSLRLSQSFALLLLGLFILSLAMGWPLLINLALVLGMVGTIYGVALVHALAKIAKIAKGWLIVFYILLPLVLSQLVLMLAVIDTWLDFRSRFQASRNT